MKNRKILINNVLEEITPQVIANLFCDMRSDEQALFFNEVAKISTKWSSSFPFQLQYITDDDGLDLGGRRVMQDIGDYSHGGNDSIPSIIRI